MQKASLILLQRKIMQTQVIEYTKYTNPPPKKDYAYTANEFVLAKQFKVMR